VSSQSVRKESLASKFGFPTKEIPGMLIGRLAVDKTFKGKGYGAITLADALKRIKVISKDVGLKIVIVDALNESAVLFYKGFGFLEFSDDPMRLFITVSSINEI
jgi:predicted GNAT family N-acyltransferase